MPVLLQMLAHGSPVAAAGDTSHAAEQLAVRLVENPHGASGGTATGQTAGSYTASPTALQERSQLSSIAEQKEPQAAVYVVL